MERVKRPMSLVNAANPAAVELDNHVSPTDIGVWHEHRHLTIGLIAVKALVR